MIYEERIYTVMPGRMADMNARFANHTMRLFEKHGIKVIGFWQTAVGRQNLELVYILAYEDANDRMRKWEAFGKDPEWLKARADSEVHGPLVAQVENKLLVPTPYSPLQ
jgi:hypothetical protein